MLNTLLLLAGLLAGGLPAPRQAAPEPPVRFEIKNAGFVVRGTLGGLEATAQFDPAHLGQAHLRASVAVGTIQTGIGLRDKHLQKPDYFDAAQFPTIVLDSKSVRQTSPAHYEGVFTLTIKGVSREVRIPFTVVATREFRGSFQLNRLDFGIGKQSLVLADEVTVFLRVPLPPE